MRVLQVSAEIFPWLKTGGLADVAGALPGALQQVGADPRLLLPGFKAILAGLQEIVTVGQFATPWGDTVQVRRGTLALSKGAPATLAYVLVAPGLYERPGGPYEDERRIAYWDNHRRFAALGWGAAHIAYGLDAQWRPELVHGHDWHAGLTPACLAYWPDASAPRPPCVYTVHNLAYQGVFGPQHFADLGLPASTFQMHGLEYHGQISFMKAGLYYAQHISTVSPTYAQEIQTPEQGCGLDGLLRSRSQQLSGILNGVDDAVWNPQTDALIAHAFGAQHMDGKALNKRALQSETGLAQNASAPLLAMVSRLTEQKGLPLLLGAADEILRQGAQLLVLGSGDAQLEQDLQGLVAKHPGQVALRLGYDEALAHRIFAGSDITLVPSRFEPCGLTQMYGMAYGSLPLVRRVGGLADTVVNTDWDTLEDGSATGFVFDHFDAADLRHALRRALALYRRPDDWNRVRRNGMLRNFSWQGPAKAYLAIYQTLLSAQH